MKKAMKFLLMYFVLLLSFICIGTIIYSIFINVTDFVAGTEINLFNNQDLLISLLYVSYCVLFLIMSFLCYYRIRHNGGIGQVIVYIFLVILTWGVLFPGVIFIERKVNSKNIYTKVQKPLTGNYFRKTGNKVYYFTRDFYSNPINFDDTTTVIIDTSENGGMSVEKIYDSPDFELYENGAPYRDILIKENFSKTNFFSNIGFKVLIQEGKQAFAKGWTFYLGFCSLGILLGAIFALCGLFKWKLLNLCYVICSTASVLVFNTLFIKGFFDPFLNSINSSNLINLLRNVFSEPVLFMINVLFSLILIITGIIIFAVRTHRQKARD